MACWEQFVSVHTLNIIILTPPYISVKHMCTVPIYVHGTPGPPGPGRTYLHARVQQTTWGKGENVKSPNQHVNTHTANTILNYIFQAIHTHLIYSLKVCLWKRFKNFVSKFQIYNKTSYCFSFDFPSDILTRVSYNNYIILQCSI